MSEATIRAQVKTVLEAVTGIGQVHDYRRTSKSVATFMQLQRSSGAVNGWTIYRRRAPADFNDNLTVTRRHYFVIAGLYELDDATASEKTVQALVDSIFAAFLGNQTLGGTCINVDPLQVDDIDNEEIEGKAYHVIEMTLVCHERVHISV